MTTATSSVRQRNTRIVVVRRLVRAFAYLVLTVFGLAFILPFLLMVRTSLMTFGDLFADPPILWPWPLIWQNYVDMFNTGPYLHMLRNTVLIVFQNVLFETTSSVLVAYGFSRVRWEGRDKLFILVLATMMVPATVTLIPQYAGFAWAGMVNTFWPLMIPRLFGHPFYIFILRQYFLTLPKELDEAAEMDGAGLWTTMTRVILPLSKPAIATVGVFSFVNHWNDFTEPLVYLLTAENQTLALGLRWFIHNQGTEYTWMMAAATVFTGPMIIAFFFAQKQFIRGIQLTGLKG